MATNFREHSMFGNPGVPSGISKLRELNARANAETMNLGLGQPYEDMPSQLRERMGGWLAKHKLGYTPNAGRADLRELIGKRYGLDPAGVSLCHGAQEGLTAAAKCLLKPGEELLMPDPGFLAYEPMTTVVGAKPKFYKLRREGNDFLYDVDAILKACTKKTRMVIVCSPGNPTSSVMSHEDRKRLLKELAKRKIFLLSDDVYSELDTANPYSPASAESKFAVTVNSWSKSLALTGWRIGFVHTDHPELRKKMIAAHQYFITCVSHPAQVLLLETFLEDGLYEKIVSGYRAQYEQKLKRLLAPIPAKAKVSLPSGGFYLFLPSPRAPEKVVEELLTKENLLIVPGGYFGKEGKKFLRVSVAASDATLDRAGSILSRLWE
jgi:aspartate/methionine/tyrosine aminotransferase